MAEKLKVACYWAASCGGCEIAVLEIHEKILNLIEVADIVFWPCVMDAKYEDVEAMPDGYIDLCLFNGAIRTSENEHIAKLLRKKSKIMVAYGSCAYEGCIPALANLYTKEEIFKKAYEESPSTHNPDKIRPQTTTKVKEGELKLPEFYNTVGVLADVVDVDYFVPGCPPTDEQTWNVLLAVVQGKLPPKGSVVGAGDKVVCDDCPFEKKLTKIKKFYRPHEIIPDGKQCLLEQGIICLGPATRSGCGALCLQANMPCRGCYGPGEEVYDMGGKMIAAIGSIIDSEDEEEIKKIVSEIVDPAGTFYRFGLSHSLLRRAKKL